MRRSAAARKDVRRAQREQGDRIAGEIGVDLPHHDSSVDDAPRALEQPSSRPPARRPPAARSRPRLRPRGGAPGSGVIRLVGEVCAGKRARVGVIEAHLGARPASIVSSTISEAPRSCAITSSRPGGGPASSGTTSRRSSRSRSFSRALASSRLTASRSDLRDVRVDGRARPACSFLEATMQIVVEPCEQLAHALMLSRGRPECYRPKQTHPRSRCHPFRAVRSWLPRPSRVTETSAKPAPSASATSSSSV